MGYLLGFLYLSSTAPVAIDEADPNRVFAQVYAHNPLTNTWRQDARMPTARHGTSPLLFQSRILVVGGGVQSGNSQSTVHEIFSHR